MTDTELLDRLDAKPFVIVPSVGRRFLWTAEVEKFSFGGDWRWYDHLGTPGHRGWTKTTGGTLREALKAWISAAVELERNEKVLAG